MNWSNMEERYRRMNKERKRYLIAHGAIIPREIVKVDSRTPSSCRRPLPPRNSQNPFQYSDKRVARSLASVQFLQSVVKVEARVRILIIPKSVCDGQVFLPSNPSHGFQDLETVSGAERGKYSKVSVRSSHFR